MVPTFSSRYQYFGVNGKSLAPLYFCEVNFMSSFLWSVRFKRVHVFDYKLLHFIRDHHNLPVEVPDLIKGDKKSPW